MLRAVGGYDVHADQLTHLCAVVDQHGAQVRIVPLRHQPVTPVAHLAEVTLPAAGTTPARHLTYQDSGLAVSYGLDDRTHRHILDTIRGKALPQADSLRLLREAATAARAGRTPALLS